MGIQQLRTGFQVFVVHQGDWDRIDVQYNNMVCDILQGVSCFATIGRKQNTVGIDVILVTVCLTWLFIGRFTRYFLSAVTCPFLSEIWGRTVSVRQRLGYISGISDVAWATLNIHYQKGCMLIWLQIQFKKCLNR